MSKKWVEATKGLKFQVVGVRPSAEEVRKAGATAKAAEKLGRAANLGRLDQVKLAAFAHERQQTIPTREQIIAHGGGVGGYLKAYRELNG